MVALFFDAVPLGLFEIAFVLVPFYYVASVIVNANHGIMSKDGRKGNLRQQCK